MHGTGHDHSKRGHPSQPLVLVLVLAVPLAPPGLGSHRSRERQHRPGGKKQHLGPGSPDLPLRHQLSATSPR